MPECGSRVASTHRGIAASALAASSWFARPLGEKEGRARGGRSHDVTISTLVAVGFVPSIAEPLAAHRPRRRHRRPGLDGQPSESARD